MSDAEQWEHDEQRMMENEITALREQVEKLTKERDECRLKCEDRKDAERYNKLVAYLISDCTEFDDAIIAARTRDEMNTVIDTM